MVVNYVGTERCDIVYYLLRIGKGLNVKTLAVDNSITGDLYHIFDKGEQDHVSEYGSVTVARNKLVGLEEAQEYDVVIIYEGLYPRYNNYRNITIFAPSENESEWEMLQPFRDTLFDSKVYCILRNAVTAKTSEKVLSAAFQLDFEEFMMDGLDDGGYREYILLQINKDAKLPRKTGIASIVTALLPVIYKVEAADAKYLKKILYS